VHNNKNKSDKAAHQQKQKAAGIRSATKTKIERERTECFEYFAFLVVPWHVRVVEMQKRITLEVTTLLPNNLFVVFDYSLCSKLSVCTAEKPQIGDIQWGTKTKKNPEKEQKQCKSSNFEGGFVKTNSPFDYPGHGKSAHNQATPASFATLLTNSDKIPRQTCSNPVQTVKLTVLLNATTDFNAKNTFLHLRAIRR